MAEVTEPRLLVVADAASNAAALETMLVPRGYRLINASRDQAARFLGDGDFAAVVVDVQAPFGDVIETAMLRLDAPPERRVPFLFLTAANIDIRDGVQAYTRRGLEYLPKPIDPETLLAKLSLSAELFRLRELLKQQTALLRQKEELYEAEILARARAESAVRAREEILAIVSHDLRNPMSTILASSSVILKRAGHEIRQQIEMIERSVSRMQKLVGDLLEEAQIEAGCLPIERHEHDAGGLASQAVDALKLVAELRTQLVGFEQRGAPCRVLCDLERIFQVLSNLIGNALNFAAPGGHIQVIVEQLDGEARFSVKDDGPGIAPEVVPHIFDRYWQAKATRRKGLGLGLAIARGIIEAHGGRIWVESQLGAGTTFYFTLPLALERDPTAAA